MAIVKGIREKVHLPIYDSIKVEPREQLRKVESSSTLKFFVNVQNKTKLETNLQSASLLPHYNTFEARAMRVIISDLPPEYPEADDKNAPTIADEDLDVLGEDAAGNEVPLILDAATENGKVELGAANAVTAITADFELTLARAMELLKQARESSDRVAELQ